MIPVFKKAFNLSGDDIVEVSTENDALKNKIGSYDEKWLGESKAKLLKRFDDEKRANFIMSRMKNILINNNKINYSYTYSNTNESLRINILVEKLFWINNFSFL